LTSDFCGLDPADFDVEDGAREMRSDPTIGRLLRFRISELRGGNALYGGQKEMAQKLRDRLRQSE